MKRIAKFEKVSKEQYLEAIDGLTGVDAVIGLDDLKLPQRMTIGSAGYNRRTHSIFPALPSRSSPIFSRPKPSGPRTFWCWGMHLQGALEILRALKFALL